MADFASESTHYYHQDGSPCYTIIGKNGKERPTTLREARTMNLVPSVTHVLNLASKPGLDNWKIDQAILAALTTPRIDGEPEADYLSRIKISSKEQASKAADRGTQIHSWVEQGFRGEFLPPVGWEGARYYFSANDTLEKECGFQDWSSEKSFARDGFGGKCDLHNNCFVIDFKTTEKDLATIKTWDEHSMQLGAYRHGLGVEGAKCGILYIHVKTAESKLLWVDEEELQKGFKCFMALLMFWYAKTGIERLRGGG